MLNRMKKIHADHNHTFKYRLKFCRYSNCLLAFISSCLRNVLVSLRSASPQLVGLAASNHDMTVVLSAAWRRLFCISFICLAATLASNTNSFVFEGHRSMLVFDVPLGKFFGEELERDDKKNRRRQDSNLRPFQIHSPPPGALTTELRRHLT